MTNEFDDVGNFHEKFGLPNTTYHPAEPHEVDEELLRFRMKFLLEEVQEFAAGAGYRLTYDLEEAYEFDVPDEQIERNHPEMFDALIDLVYVAMGTAHLFGYPWRDGWALVQLHNMRKHRAAKDGSDSKRGTQYDVVKPEGWVPPDITDLLKRAGWNV